MKVSVLVAFALGVGAIVAAVPAVAHHAFAAEFDANQPLTVTGTVTKIEWTNPLAGSSFDTGPAQERESFTGS